MRPDAGDSGEERRSLVNGVSRGGSELANPNEALEGGDYGDSPRPRPALQRSLGVLDATAVIVGSMIGSGIFTSPGLVLQETAESVPIALLCWVLGGLLVGLAALVYAELGCMLPSCGGEVRYFQEAFGDTGSFAFVWASALALRPCSQAVISIVISRYLVAVAASLRVLPLPVSSMVMGGASMVSNVTVSDGLSRSDDSGLTIQTVVALCALFSMGVVNTMSTKCASAVQRALTAAKLLLVATVLVAGVMRIAGWWTPADTNAVNGTSGPQHQRQQYNNSNSNTASTDPTIAESPPFLMGVSGGVSAALFSYGGWNHANYVVEELKHPEWQLPTAIVLSISIVAVVYLSLNGVFIAALSPHGAAHSTAVAVDVFGHGGVAPGVIGVIVALTTLASLNVSLLCGARIMLEAARAGIAPPCLKRLNARGAPFVAVWVQVFAATPLVLYGELGSILHHMGFVSWAFYGTSGVVLLLLRRRRPDALRPFRVSCYPLVPLMMIGMSATLVIALFADAPLQSTFVALFVGISMPSLYLFRFLLSYYRDKTGHSRGENL